MPPSAKELRRRLAGRGTETPEILDQRMHLSLIHIYRNAHRIFQCALIYVLVVGGIASLFVFFFASYMVDLGGSVLPLRILAPTIFFSGILGVFRGYFQAHKSMVQTSVSQILEQIVNAGVSVLMAYLLVRMVKGESETTQASFGAAGGTIGTGAGVVFALLFMMGVYALNKGMIHRQIDRDKTIHEDSRKEIFKMIIMVVTPFILSTAIYNINTFLDQKIYQMISLTIQQKTEAAVSFDLSAMAKATKLANIPIALASAMATALIPGISSDFARGDLEGAKSKDVYKRQPMKKSSFLSAMNTNNEENRAITYSCTQKSCGLLYTSRCV